MEELTYNMYIFHLSQVIFVYLLFLLLQNNDNKASINYKVIEKSLYKIVGLFYLFEYKFIKVTSIQNRKQLLLPTVILLRENHLEMVAFELFLLNFLSFVSVRILK